MLRTKQKLLSGLLTILVIIGSLTTFVKADTLSTSQSQASSTVATTRIAGNNKYATADAIAEKGWTQSDTVVIASGVDFPDGLCAGPLAHKYNAPILLASENGLDDETLGKITRLKATKVIIIGGTGAIPSNVETQLSGIGITSIQRIGGTDRYDTSVLVAQQLNKPSGVVITSGENYPDALSISSIASQQGMPIILASKDGLSDEALSYIQSSGTTETYIVGGTGVLSSSIESQVPNPVRLSGEDRYGTNLAVLNQFASSLKFDNEYLATGNDFSDALVGSQLAAETQSPVILAGNDLNYDMMDYLVEHKAVNTNLVAIGDSSTVPDYIFDEAQGSDVQAHEVASRNANLNSSIVGPVVEAKADEIIAQVIKPGMSDFEKELALHDYVDLNTAYDWKNFLNNTIPDVDGTAYGVLINGTGVCQGFAEAMDLLLNKVGIEDTVIEGTADGYGGNGGHAWNIVKIYGHYYHLDATWDDQDDANGKKEILHNYFNLTDGQISKDHQWDTSGYPKCEGGKYNYDFYNYCKTNNIPLDSAERKITGTICLPDNNVDYPEGSMIHIDAYTHSGTNGLPSNEYSQSSYIVIPHGANSVSYSLIVPPSKDGYSISYGVGDMSIGYYSKEGITANCDKQTLVSTDDVNNTVNLNLLPSCSIKGTISLPIGDTAPKGGQYVELYAYIGQKSFFVTDVKIPEGSSSVPYSLKVPQSTDGYSVSYKLYCVGDSSNGYYSADGTTTDYNKKTLVYMDGIDNIDLTILKGN